MQQRGRLLSALVRPLMWLAVFAVGFHNVFGVSIIPPYKTYISYQVYIVPGLLGIILLFHGMQSSLSMVYDREMGVMRLLLTAPLPRWVLLACKLIAGTVLSVITCYVFLAVCILFDVTFEVSGWLYVLPALVASGLMLGALWLFLSVYIRQVENFAGAMSSIRSGSCARAAPSCSISFRWRIPSPMRSSSSVTRSTACSSRWRRRLWSDRRWCSFSWQCTATTRNAACSAVPRSRCEPLPASC